MLLTSELLSNASYFSCECRSLFLVCVRVKYCISAFDDDYPKFKLGTEQVIIHKCISMEVLHNPSLMESGATVTRGAKFSLAENAALWQFNIRQVSHFFSAKTLDQPSWLTLYCRWHHKNTSVN